MDIQAPFGFVTGCHAGDKFMVGATLASIRYYCPDVPICLIADGGVDVSNLEQEYDLIVLRIDALPSREMTQRITGSCLAKLAAMWEGPFEYYVWLDSDACLWGDVTADVKTELDFQIFWSEVSIPEDADEIPSWLPHYYFNPKKLEQFDPRFEWRGHPYFCAGVYACRRNAITYQQWIEIEQWQKQSPDLFQFGDIGMLNYIVHSKRQREEMRVAMTDLQHIWAHHGKEELAQDCIGSSWRFPEHIERPRIAHFCGRKPSIFDRQAYSKPFTIARLEHHRRRHSVLGAWGVILWEDGRTCLRKLWGRTKRCLSKYLPSI